MNSELESLRRFDENADELYPKLVGAADITIDRTTGEIFRDKRGEIFLGIGIPDLLFRLECQQTREQKAGRPPDGIARARIWRHVAEACKPGDAIADITHDYQLNNWLPESHPKFARQLIQRNCESCSLPWDVCENHFTLTPPVLPIPFINIKPEQQMDSRKKWLCYSCKVEAVRKQYLEETTAKPNCGPKKRKKRRANTSYLQRLNIAAAVDSTAIANLALLSSKTASIQ